MSLKTHAMRLAIAAFLATGCDVTVSSSSLNLAKSGFLSLNLDYDPSTDKSRASAFALTQPVEVRSSFLGGAPILGGLGAFLPPHIRFERGETLVINGKTIPFAQAGPGGPGEVLLNGDVPLGAEPGKFLIEFQSPANNHSMNLTRPDVPVLSPGAQSVVSHSGFRVTWDASTALEGDKVHVSVFIANMGINGGIFTSEQSDNGVVEIPATALLGAPSGPINIFINRQRKVPQELGFAGGSVTLSVNVTHQLVLQ